MEANYSLVLGAKERSILLRAYIGQYAHRCPNDLHEGKWEHSKSIKAELKKKFSHPPMIFNAVIRAKFKFDLMG
jgi:hypothetical protein